MSWKRYQNEFIAISTFILMILAYMYKHNQVVSHVEESKSVTYTLEEIKEGIALKKIWTDKKINKKIEVFKIIVPSSKVSWSKKNKKITASYQGLSSNELNNLIIKILNTPVQITLLDIQKTGLTYNMEFKCKW